MSDGVYNALSQEEICLAMRHPAQDAAEAIGSFISTKNFQDQDNYTLVILECC
jgi:serine/threonine protein phosphatase PrpC